MKAKVGIILCMTFTLVGILIKEPTHTYIAAAIVIIALRKEEVE